MYAFLNMYYIVNCNWDIELQDYNFPKDNKES